MVATTPVTTTINGEPTKVDVRGDESAVTTIRDRLGLTGTKHVCGQGVCGACTVLVDGAPVVSCLLPATALEGRDVSTIEAIGRVALHPVQRAFAVEDALQCGFCTPGFVVESAAFHDRWRQAHGAARPDRETVASALAGHLCRCGAYERICAAVQRACAGEFDDDGAVATPPRREALDKVTGSARYTTDVREAGQLEGRILRSPHAHARIVRLDTRAAEAVPGVRAVFVFPGPREVRYAGQEIAAVAADDAATAAEAVRRIDVEYEVRPFVLDSADARARGAPMVYPLRARLGPKEHANEGPLLPALWRGNLRGPFFLFSHRARRARAILASASAAPGWSLVRGRWTTQAQSHTCFEPHAAVAAWRGRALTVYASTQAVTRLAHDIAERWGLDPLEVRVVAAHVGGAFGSKAELGPELVAAVELARAAQAPVRVALGRREELTIGGSRPQEELHTAHAIDAAGALAATGLRAYANAGVAVGNVTSMIFRIMYPHGAKDLRDWDVVTHAPPGKPFRGPGGPPAFWALEQAVDEIARMRGEDPIALRRRWDTSPVRLQLYDWVETLEVWRARGHRADRGRFRRGVGLAAAGWFDFIGTDTRVRVESSRDGIVVSTGTQDVGNGSRTALAEAAAAIFDLPASRIEVRLGDSTLPPGPMSAGSRTTASVVPCVEEAALALREALATAASARWRLSGARAVQSGIAHDAGLLPWAEALAGLSPMSRTGRRVRDPGGYFLPLAIGGMAVGRYLSGAVQVTEVEVDVRLGRIRVLRTWAGLGAGRLVAPRLARSQVEGAIVQGIGYALYEQRHLDPHSGAVLTASLDDYRLAGLGDTPEITVRFVEDGFEQAGSRVVGLGELGTLATAASIGNAVREATGWRPRDLPMRPDRVLDGLRR